MNNAKFIPALTLLFLLSFFACKETQNRIPNVYVNFNINLNDPEFFVLNAPGNLVIVNGGARGIIIYRKSVDEFLAVDRNCTFDPFEDCAVIKQSKEYTFIFEDTCCGSKFSLLLDGFPTEGPASIPLKQYYVSFNSNSQMLYISN